MSEKPTGPWRWRVALLISSLVIAGLIAAVAAITPILSGRPLSAQPAGPPTGPGTATGSPTASGTGKPAKRPKDAAPVEPYSGKGKVQPVKSEHRVIDKLTAAKVVGSYVKAVPKIKPDTKKVKNVVGDIAGSAVEQELANQLAELNSNGWTLSGEPVVTSASIIERKLKGSPPEVTVKACIDSSQLVTLDADGKRVGSLETPPPAYNLYRLQQRDDGSWLLVAHSFPADLAC